MSGGVRAVRLACVALALLAGATPTPAEEAGESAPASFGLPLPTLAQCQIQTPPALPARWRATATMAPVTSTQLDVAEFIHDDALPATRATVYGLESGAADLLITDTDTYLLTGPHAAPTGCVSLGRQFTPLSGPWLGANAQCAGTGPVLGHELEWWRTPAEENSANWFWYRTKSRLPWRVLMISPGREPAVLGRYAMTHFAQFAPLARTNLARLRDFCRKRAKPASIAATYPDVRAIMAKHGNATAEKERPRRIAALVPGLSREACDTVSNSTRWPDRFATTTIMVSTMFQHGPFPSEVFYDWDARSQVTRVHEPRRIGVATLDALLKGEVGYELRRDAFGDLTCKVAYPGVIRPDWLSGKGCECKGVIRNNPALAPPEGLEIRACPVQPRFAFWAWYALGGRPVTFIATARDPDGLMLADYYHWDPGRAIASGTLELPAVCKMPDKDPKLGIARARLLREHAKSCSNCHTTQTRPGLSP